jgi:dTMP kinase
MSKGKLILISGPDGCGKTTQAKLLVKALQKRFGKEKIIHTYEPGGSLYGKEIRELILNGKHAADANGLTMMLLFFAARADHIRKIIKPALLSGKVVVSDRFDESTFSYQIFGQKEKHLLELFKYLRHMMMVASYRPHYLILDIQPNIARSRMKDRGKMSHFDKRGLSFHERVRQGFKVFSKSYGGDIIDGNGTIEEVHARVMAEVERIF